VQHHSGSDIHRDDSDIVQVTGVVRLATRIWIESGAIELDDRRSIHLGQCNDRGVKLNELGIFIIEAFSHSKSLCFYFDIGS
jgi:hypothetical protein